MDKPIQREIRKNLFLSIYLYLYISPISITILYTYINCSVCYGPENLKFSSDIMGAASDTIEQMIGGVALFVNGDAGDISPSMHLQSLSIMI